MMKNDQTILLFFCSSCALPFFLSSRFFLYFLQPKKYILSDIRPLSPRPGPRIVLEKKVFRDGDTFDCPTGADAEVVGLLPEDEKPDELLRWYSVGSDAVLLLLQKRRRPYIVR